MIFEQRNPVGMMGISTTFKFPVPEPDTSQVIGLICGTNKLAYLRYHQRIELIEKLMSFGINVQHGFDCRVSVDHILY